jgi:Transporter associated domain
MKLSSVQVSKKRGWYRVILDSDRVRAEFVGHARRIYDTAQVCGIWLQEVAEFQCATVVRHVSSSLLFILLPRSARFLERCGERDRGHADESPATPPRCDFFAGFPTGGAAIVSRQAETGDGTDLVDGLLRLDEFIERTGIELPAGPYDTVGGLVVDRLGRVAEVGDAVEE